MSAAREEVIAAAERPRNGEAFAETVMAAVGREIGFDGYCLFGLDPASFLRSYMFCRDGVGDPQQLAHNEFETQDVHRYLDLARARVPVGVLHDGSTQAHSPRLQEILRPAGMSSELRMALRHRGIMHGALVLFRATGERAFLDRDIRAALELAEPLTAAVRSYPVRRSTEELAPLAPGLLVLDAQDRMVEVTVEAG